MVPFFRWSILVGGPSPKKIGKRALLGDLVRQSAWSRLLHAELGITQQGPGVASCSGLLKKTYAIWIGCGFRPIRPNRTHHKRSEHLNARSLKARAGEIAQPRFSSTKLTPRPTRPRPKTQELPRKVSGCHVNVCHFSVFEPSFGHHLPLEPTPNENNPSGTGQQPTQTPTRCQKKMPLSLSSSLKWLWVKIPVSPQ